MMSPKNNLHTNGDEPPFLDVPEPPPEGLGEFVETIIDWDGEVEPDLLESPQEEKADDSTN